MTSRLLRKLQTTQWSILHQIFDAARAVTRRRCRCAVAARRTVLKAITLPLVFTGGMLAAGGMPAAADDILPPVTEDAAVQLPEPSAPQNPLPLDSPAAALSRGTWRAAQQPLQVPEIPQADEQVESPPVPSEEEPLPAAEMPGPVTSHNVSPHARWQNGHRQRITAVLNGHDYFPDPQIDDYWHSQSTRFVHQNRRLSREFHEESVEFQQNNRHLVAGAVTGAVHTVNSVRSMVQFDELPGEDDGPDAWETMPILAELGPVRTAGQATDESGANASQRLIRDITSIHPTLDYALRGIEPDQLPDEFFTRMDNGSYREREPSPMVLQWAPTNLWHHPLYFEDPALERYGHTYHPLVQPFASTARFTTQLVGIPYQMALHPIWAHEYPLGWYRPGEFAPKLHYQIPFNQEAAMTQAAAVAGFLLIFP